MNVPKRIERDSLDSLLFVIAKLLLTITRHLSDGPLMTSSSPELLLLLGAFGALAACAAYYFWSVATERSSKLALVEKDLNFRIAFLEEELSEEKKARQQSWTSFQEAVADLEKAARDAKNARSELELRNYELEATKRQVREMLDTPPMPSDQQLGQHLAMLVDRLTASIGELEIAYNNSNESLAPITSEAEKARVVERKARFVDYREMLTVSNTELISAMEQLRSAIPVCITLQKILDCGDVDSGVGSVAVGKIVKVLESFSAEDLIDDISLKRLRSRNSEYLRMLHERDILRAREREKGDLGVNRQRPLTPFEKFKQIKPTGSRDGFSPPD